MSKLSYFISKEHVERFENLKRENGLETLDADRYLLFYLVSGNADLYKKRAYIYDFKDKSILLSVLENVVDLPSSSSALVRLAFNLYNGFQDESCTPFQIFYNLDTTNNTLAMNAIKMRFSGY